MFFDINDGDFVFGGIDSEGHQMIKMGRNALDMDTGEVHCISSWDDDDDDNWGSSNNSGSFGSAWDDDDW